VTFHEVAGAWFHICDPLLSPDRRRSFQELYPELLEMFAKPRGGIVTAYFCRNLRVAAALTDIHKAAELSERVPVATMRDEAQDHQPEATGRLLRLRRAAGDPSRNGHVAHADPNHAGLFSPTRPIKASSSAIHIEPTFGDPGDWPAKKILFTCLDLHYRSLEFLTPKPRKICMRLIFGVITSLLGTLDSRHASGGDDRPFGADPTEVDCLERELARAERYYERAAQRTAQLEYFVGMFAFGLPLLLALTGLAAWVADTPLLEEPLFVSLIAGGAGAIVSVLNRMTSGRLILLAESGKAVIRLLGAIRPLVGAVFGLAVLVLLSADLVSFVEPPPAGSARMLFGAGLGFIAGFSERFAQDMIAGAAGGRTSTKATAAVQPEVPDAGRSRPATGS
jgi:hypothetical protein